MSLGKLVNMIVKSEFEYKNGRIRQTPSGYMKKGVYTGAEKRDFERLGEPPAWSIKEQNGITFQMVSIKSVMCPYPEMHKEAYAVKGRAMIPASKCRKCVHRIKADKKGGLRFPRCAKAIEDRKEE